MTHSLPSEHPPPKEQEKLQYIKGDINEDLYWWDREGPQANTRN